MQQGKWHVVILAAGRGPDDPMSKAFGVTHKCSLPIAGKPMLAWVVDALSETAIEKPFLISIDDATAAEKALGSRTKFVQTLKPASSAPTSALQAIQHLGEFPVLITTGDHPLLTANMINHMLEKSQQSGADVTVGLATAETINASRPETKRTYFNLGGTKVSGCNLFAVMNPRGLIMLEAWASLEKNRKKPWKLISAFGLLPLLYYITNQLTPDQAFNWVSKKLGIRVSPVFLPFAEAAIDVDKPSDHTLAERILLERSRPV